MQHKPQDILRRKVARNAGAVLSVRHLDDVVHLKSRFLNQDDDGGVWLQCPMTLSGPWRHALDDERKVGLTFRDGVDRVVCIAQLEAFERLHSFGSEQAPGLKLARPTEIRHIRRRDSYRVSTMGETLELRVFCRRRGSPAIEVENVTLRDISLGGAGLLARKPFATDVAPIQAGDVLSLQAQWMNLTVPLQGSALFVQPSGKGYWRIGMRWDDPGSSKRSEQVKAELNRLVAELQRREARRMWKFLTGK